MPFPNQDAGVGQSRPFRKLTVDIDGVEMAAPTSAVFEPGRMTNGQSRLLVTAPPDRPQVFRTLAALLTGPLFVLYVLHTPRGEGPAGRYQSPPLDSQLVDHFLTTFEAFLAGDGRHDIWVHSHADERTLVWDRHDLIHAEGEPLEDMVMALEAMAFEQGIVLHAGAGPHLHHYRPEFDADAAEILVHFDWTRIDLRPEDEQ